MAPTESFRQQMIGVLERVADGDYHQVWRMFGWCVCVYVWCVCVSICVSCMAADQGAEFLLGATQLAVVYVLNTDVHYGGLLGLLCGVWKDEEQGVIAVGYTFNSSMHVCAWAWMQAHTSHVQHQPCCTGIRVCRIHVRVAYLTWK